MRFVPIDNPSSPWSELEVEYDGPAAEIGLEVYEDRTGKILSENRSPDLGFRYSVNPYRGCFHGCSYCYARRGHEHLSWGAGTDFDRKLVVKPDAPRLLREALAKKRRRDELVMFSGMTDCYQPLEARFGLTRACLEVCAEFRVPVRIVTKSVLVERDVDVLQKLSERSSVVVTLSIPFWNKQMARLVEPYVPSPERRFRAAETLRQAGINVAVFVAPVIPGLNDVDLPRIMQETKARGVEEVGMSLLWLPGSVRQVFLKRLYRDFPERAAKVERRLSEMHGDALSTNQFGKRFEGRGKYAQSIQTMFRSRAKALGLRLHMENVAREEAKAPAKEPTKRQLSLF